MTIWYWYWRYYWSTDMVFCLALIVCFKRSIFVATIPAWHPQGFIFFILCFKLNAFPSWFDFCQNVHNKVLVLFCSWQIFHYNYFGVNPLFEKLERMPETQFKCKVLKKKNTSTASPFIEYFWRCKTECSSKCYNKY